MSEYYIDYYLAAPYTDPDPGVREDRADKICSVAADLAAEGRTLYSPITHGHPIEGALGYALPWDYWRQIDLAILPCCRALLVLTLTGWEESVGVKEECRAARTLGKPMLLIDEGLRITLPPVEPEPRRRDG